MEWVRVRDRGTGREGLVPADIIEDVNERAARINTAKNAANIGDTVVTSRKEKDSINSASTSKKDDKIKKIKKKRAQFSSDAPQEISPMLSVPVHPPHQQQQQPATNTSYDRDLEERLRRLLVTALDDRPGQLIRIYAGLSMSSPSSTYKTIRVDPDATVQEMLLSAGLKYHTTTTNSILSITHADRGTIFRLDPAWRLWQVTKLAKMLTLYFGDGIGVGRKAERVYGKMARACKGGDYGAVVAVLKRREGEEYNFTTRFQFVLDRQ
jgi:hypothetical protein